MAKEPRSDDYMTSKEYEEAIFDWQKREAAHRRAIKYMRSDKPIEQHAPGAKMDQDKIDMSLLEFLPNALLEICRVMDYGQTKYSRGGFLEVPDAKNRYTAAMLRHWLDECNGIKYDEGDPFYDTEKGLPFKGTLRHDAQIAVNAIFRLEVILRDEYEQHLIDTHLDEAEAPQGANITMYQHCTEAVEDTHE